MWAFPEPWGSADLGAMLMTGTLSLFPLLGRTPPPWRSPRDVLATSFATHALYVAGVSGASALIAAALESGSRSRRRSSPVS